MLSPTPAPRTPAPIAYAWVLGVVLWLIALLGFLVPASRMGGQLDVGPFGILLLFGFVLIALSVVAFLVRLNQTTEGAVGGFMRAAGTGYVAYKGAIAIRRHLHHEITED